MCFDTHFACFFRASRGLLGKQTYGNGDYIDFTYDNLDRITKKVYNGDASTAVQYAYDSEGRTSTIKDTENISRAMARKNSGVSTYSTRESAAPMFTGDDSLLVYNKGCRPLKGKDAVNVAQKLGYEKLIIFQMDNVCFIIEKLKHI